jgi:hypothetical protein
MGDPSGQREHSAADLATGVLSKPARLLGRPGSAAARAGFGAQLSRVRKAQKDSQRGWISASELPQSAMSARTRYVKEIWSGTMNENPTVVEQGKWIADVRHGVLAFLSRSDAVAQIGIDFSPRLFKVAVVLVSGDRIQHARMRQLLLTHGSRQSDLATLDPHEALRYE